MNRFTLTGSDTLILNDRIFSDFVDQDAVLVEFPNELSTTTKGKNGNAVIAKNSQGSMGTMTLRILRGSPDDKYLNSLVNLFELDSASFPLIFGEFTKRLGDGEGNVNEDNYVCSGGVISSQPGASSNANGDTEQGVSVVVITFATIKRAIG